MLKKITMLDLRYAGLFLALALYAAFSSPTPDQPGVIEGVIALLLVGVSLPRVSQLVQGGFSARNLWQSGGFFFLLYGVSVCSLVGALYNDLHYVVRDLVPFFFLFLPLFTADLFVGRSRRGRFLIGFVLLMGCFSAVRALAEGLDFLSFNFSSGQELYYLANAPTILFAACLGWFGFLFGVSGTRRYGVSALGLLMFLLGFVVMGMTLQRASLGFLLLYSGVVSALVAWQRPRVLVFIMPVALLMGAFLWGDLLLLFDALASKTEQFGFNNRAEEWQAVWREATASLSRFLLGGGFGATFESPAVAGERVNFTHGMMGAALLKTGLAGLVFLCAYLLGMIQMLWALLKRHFIIGFAIVGPFLIDVFLYGAYKSLDFGVMLLLIPVALLSRFSEEA